MSWKKSNKRVPISELVKMLGAELLGDPSGEITGISPVDSPTVDHIAFTKKHNASELSRLINDTALRALIIDREASRPQLKSGKAVLVVDDPAQASRLVTGVFYSFCHSFAGISAKAEISKSAKLGQQLSIGAFSVIGDDVEIGDDVVIYPHVVIYPGAAIGVGSVIHSHAVIREGVKIGPGSTIQCGAIVGGEGFGYLPDPKHGIVPVPQVGTVVLGPSVDIGANACVDRGTLGDTRIGRGTKIDNLVQVGHNVQIGEFAILCGQAAVAGSAKIGNFAVLGGGAGVADHVTVPDRTRLAAHTGMTENVEKAGDYAGMPPMPIGEWRRLHALLRWLVPRAKSLRALLEEKEK